MLHNESIGIGSTPVGSYLENDAAKTIHHAVCIFQQPWWLDAVAPGQWSEAIINRGGRIIARFPYVARKKYGLTIISQPQLTPHLGPWFYQSDHQKNVYKIAEQRKLMAELLDQIPPFDYFFQGFHYSVTDFVLFHWQGFQLIPRYYYVIKEPNLDMVWEGLDRNVRTTIRRAEKYGITIIESDDIDTLLKINRITFEKQGLKVPYSNDYVRRIDEACKRHQARKILLAYDRNGRCHSGLYLAFDEDSVHSLIGCSDPELSASGAYTLTFWEGIKFATATSRSFDFKGSWLKQVEPFIRRFGGHQQHYCKIMKINSSILKIAYHAREYARTLIGPRLSGID